MEDLDVVDNCQTKSHFEHAEEALGLITALNTTDGIKALGRLSEILDMYQEQSHLLDPYLEAMVGPVVSQLRTIVVKENAGQDIHHNCHLLFRYLYLLTKTRGYKTIVKFMSHEVTDLEPVFDFLCNMQGPEAVPWETRYISFIWLSLICMIPFDLKRVDSGSDNEVPLVPRMIELCKQYLKSTGKERDGAGLLLARLLSRRDLCAEALEPFIEWSKSRLNSDADVFETAGILSCLCAVYQFAPRTVLLPTLDHGVIPLLNMAFFDDHANNSLIRKLRVKLTQRVGLCFLKPKIAPWRYQRGNRSLRQNLEETAGQATAWKDNAMIDSAAEDEDEVPENMEIIIDILLNGLRDKDTIVRWSAAKGVGRITQRLPRELAEDVIGWLLELFQENTLTSPSTGIIDLSAVSDSTWHGTSLAIAELARRGLLLPERLPETIPWIIRALKYDQKRGSHSIGAHVRDAACYVCWSFARAYAPSIMEPYVAKIAQTLVVVSVFDREINVRRASSAAFQENVGRQGIFPAGIDIIQLADYFTVGNRSNAFLKVAYNIAKFEAYRYPMIQHLTSVTIRHWDKAMRVLAAAALNRLVDLDPRYFIDSILPELTSLAVSTNMQESHGAILAVAEICLALYGCRSKDAQLEAYWQENSKIVKDIMLIISRIPPRSLTTFGSEQIHEASCRLIECMARTHMPCVSAIPGDQNPLDAWRTLVHTSLERKEENVQQFAVGAFEAMASSYGIDKETVYMALDKIASTRMLYGRRGYALALGTVVYTEPEERRFWLRDVLRHLCSGAQVQQEAQANDAESKRNAVMGLHSIVKRLGDDLCNMVSKSDFDALLNSLQLCLTDYSTDQRGDVGSWVRTAAMECLRTLILLTARLDRQRIQQPYLTPQATAQVVAGLLKQSVERIDRVRDCAGRVLCDFLYDDQTLLSIPDRDLLERAIARDLSWSSPAELYPVVTPILSSSLYRYELLAGLIASAGGLTESLVRHSSNCLLEYMNTLRVEGGNEDACLTSMVKTLLDLFSNYEKQERVILPLMDVIGLLYEAGILNKIMADDIHNKILLCVRKECIRSKNIRKLSSAIKVYAGMTSLKATPTKKKALQQLLSYLVHSFPRIRLEASDQLYSYLAVLDEDEMTEGTMEAEEILTSTDWAGSLPEIKPIREQLYSLLNVPKPVLKSVKSK
ncbi:armadillo-type protein [Dichotomocladium elegans]|nr:armadillo-type protein [Dichotomocladium elegans]